MRTRACACAGVPKNTQRRGLRHAALGPSREQQRARPRNADSPPGCPQHLVPLLFAPSSDLPSSGRSRYPPHPPGLLSCSSRPSAHKTPLNAPLGGIWSGAEHLHHARRFSSPVLAGLPLWHLHPAALVRHGCLQVPRRQRQAAHFRWHLEEVSSPFPVAAHRPPDRTLTPLLDSSV